MAQGIIYLITNKENSHKYIGQTTKTMNKRWQEHISESTRMSSAPLHRAFRKYGVHKFTIKQIDECNVSLLDEREEYWIKHYNTFESVGGYNATSGGGRVIFNEETKEKIGIAVSNAMFEKRTDEWNNKIRQINQQKAKETPWGFMLKENRGDGKHTAKRVMGINIETGEEKIWESFTAAALEVAGNKQANANIHQAVKNGTKAFGYRWKRLDNTTNKTPIKGVHKKTWEEIHFSSISEAGRYFGVTNVSGIRKSLLNPHKYSYMKYYWFYLT
jgi:group I intron endonuclease